MGIEPGTVQQMSALTIVPLNSLVTTPVKSQYIDTMKKKLQRVLLSDFLTYTHVLQRGQAQLQ